jgi:ADP-ribose pyrophosphatase YjhB (NUDIX family)
MRIRPIVLAVVRRADDLLVFEATDHHAQETFFRPLGGGIEFGERADDALRREFREELGAELGEIQRLDVLENIFHHNGQPGHEIAFIFAAELADPGWYERDELGTVADTGEPVSWQPMASFASGRAPLYPTGLPRLLGI